MEAARIQNKIKLLFEKISEPKYVLNTYYADSFINKISDATEPDSANLIALPLLPDLLVEALADTTKYDNTVNVFLGRILAIVCKNEMHFCKILEQRKDTLYEFLSNVTSKNMNPSLKVAYVEIAMSLITHRTGVSWLLKTELWRQILSLYDNSTTVFVLRLMYKFSAEFMWKLNDYEDVSGLTAVVGFILQPLLEFNFSNSVTFSIDQERQLCEKFEPILQMLIGLVKHKERLCFENRLADLLVRDRGVITRLYILFSGVRSDETLLLIARLVFYMTLLRVFQEKPYTPGQLYCSDDFIEVVVIYFNTMHSLIQKRNVVLVLDYCTICICIWKTIYQTLKLHNCSTDDVPRQEPILQMPNQLLLVYLAPILVYVYSTLAERSVTGGKDDDIVQYMSRYINMACEHTARAAYAMRDLILELDPSAVMLQCVKRLTCIKDHLNDEQANIVFQTLFYALREYDPLDDNGEAKPLKDDLEKEEHEMLVMTHVIDTIITMVKSYNIHWHKSLEIICLNSVVHNILMRKANLTCKFTVSALHLLKLIVAKFLPPNLSLLMETQPGSAMHEIGTLIFNKLHDVHWEVRDSALELLNVCTEISYIKFPPLHKQILERNLINVAVTMALNDHEPYVQVSALRCVAAASRVAPIWEQVKAQYPELTEKLIEILRHNQEGIVRREACNVLCDMYQTSKVTAAQKPILYEHLASAAMSDFHWEVQIVALKFWKIVIQFFLTDQGMLDGSFPPVTFSRESRKIVTLNDKEIRKRLMKLMDDLGSIGCLTALLKLLHDDTEVEVMETAFNVANDLYTILQKYKVPEYVTHVEGEPRSIAELVCHIKEESEDLCELDMEPESSNRAENIIEGILNVDDMSLLTNMYQKGMNLQKEPLTPKIKLLKTASPYLFVDFMKTTDCKKIIGEKKAWKEGIRSLSSLLDDVLGLYETGNEYNSLDCY